jgi:altronate dehydratase large subunit
MELCGFRRSGGQVGFRNSVLVVPLTGCQMEIARRIASSVPGAACLGHANGCDLQGHDFELLGTFLEHFATHPNVGGVVFLAMGCAATLSLELPMKARASGRLVSTLNAQKGGTSAVVEAGTKIVQRMVAELALAERHPMPFSGLVVGTKCGASDRNSLAYCHPVVGRACDTMIAMGATVVLSEDCELVAAADLLADRADSFETAEKIRRMAEQVNRGWKARFGRTLDDHIPKDKTRQDMVQASLERAAKAGTTRIKGFFDMAEPVKGPGLVILNAPNTDLESVTSLAAAGCNVTLFTTGRGTPVGSPASITLKITATQETFESMEENIDLCVAGVIDGRESIDDAANRVVRAVVDAANGQLTKAERLGHWEVAIPIRGVTY